MTASSTREGPSTPASTHLDAEQLPPTLSIEQAAELVGIGRNAAYRAAHSGDIPSFRVGRKLRVPTAALLRLLAMDGTPTMVSDQAS